MDYQIASRPELSRGDVSDVMSRWPMCKKLSVAERERVLNTRFSGDDNMHFAERPLAAKYNAMTADEQRFYHERFWRLFLTTGVALLIVGVIARAIAPKATPIVLGVLVAGVVIFCVVGAWRLIYEHGVGGFYAKTAYLWQEPN